jgi:hypothetical protein
VLSKNLHCRIENFGTDGYALDQTYLAMRDLSPVNSLVIVAIIWPMLHGDMLTSTTFMTLDQQQAPSVFTTKPLFRSNGDDLELVHRPKSTLKAIEAYYDLDAAKADWTALSFPYSLSVARAIFKKFDRVAFADIGPIAPAAYSGPIRSLGIQLIGKIDSFAAANHDRLALVFLPAIDTDLDARGLFGSIIEHLPSNLCTIDPTQELQTARRAGAIGLPNGHYNAAGNAAVAKAISRGLKECGLSS